MVAVVPLKIGARVRHLREDAEFTIAAFDVAADGRLVVWLRAADGRHYLTAHLSELTLVQ